MSLAAGVHYLPAGKIEWLIHEGLEQGWEFYVLPETSSVKDSASEAAYFDLPELPLDPPESLVGQFAGWGDRLYDSLWGGVQSLTSEKVGLVWSAASITAQRDPEQYTAAIDYLTELRSEYKRRKEIAVLIPR